jgi:predicted DsbA family dithiol-disulfide isomerase
MFSPLETLAMSDNTNTPTVVDYYTDILCVWAWIAQPRLEELQKQWSRQIKVRYRYVDIFGDAHTKIAQRWGADDGFATFGAHITHSAEPFADTPVHPDCWTEIRPRSSLPAHLLLKAVAIVSGDDALKAMALKIRGAFFVEAQDIGDLDFLLELAQCQGLDSQGLKRAIMDGRAMAELSADQLNARDLGVRGSPTWVLNEGRQILYGNVGYRILNANIEELLKRPGAEASWC